MTPVILKPVDLQELCITNHNKMQKPIRVISFLQLGLKVGVIMGIIFFVLQMSGAAKAAVLHSTTKAMLAVVPDSSITAAIKTAETTGGLLFPLSVERFYAITGNNLIWIASEKIKNHKWDAMMLLDCVVQYGLIPADYHPAELTYDQLHLMVEHPEKVSDAQKAAYDILLTDAMITLINNLHYGKLNMNFRPKN